MTLSSDALSRHLRQCEIAQLDTAVTEKIESVGLKKQTRVKRACDSCAKQKLKCTFQVPCDHCHRKQLPCTYTRGGYVDPYEDFRVGKGKFRPDSEIARQRAWSSTAANTELGNAQRVDESSASGIDENQSNGISSRLPLPNEPSGATKEIVDLSSLVSYEMDTSCLTQEQDFNYSQAFSPTDFDIAANLTFPFAGGSGNNLLSLSLDMTQQAHHYDPQNSFDNIGTGQHFLSTLRSTPFVLHADPSILVPLLAGSCQIATPPLSAFNLRQLDPVEAKCIEIRELLYGTDTLVQKHEISSYITRQNVLLCGQLFGTHLSRSVPILHPATFMLTEAPPILVLAVLLAGACYSNSIIPSNCITRFAMNLLILIEREKVCLPKVRSKTLCQVI